MPMFYNYKNTNHICKSERSENVTQHFLNDSKSLIYVKDKKSLPLYQRIFDKNFELISLNSLISAIQTGKVLINGKTLDFTPLIAKIRQANKDGKQDLKSNLKKQLPAVLVSVILPQGAEKKKENIKEFTGLIQIDFDHVPNLSETKEKLKKDPFTYVMFTSPSGDGLKLIVKIDTSKDFGAIFYGLSDYYKQNYGLELDRSTKNPNRLMFLSYDKDVFVNPNADTFKKAIEQMDVHTSTKTEKTDVRTVMSVPLNGRFLEKIWQNVEQKILSAPDGQRHDTVLKQSRLIGGLVAQGLISEFEAEQRLLSIVDLMDTNNRADKIRAVKDGLKDGLKDPLEIKTKQYVPAKIKRAEKALKDKQKHKIEYDYILKAKERVSEVVKDLIELINKHDKILIQAQTGTGKTYAIIKELAPKLGKTIIAVPYIRLAEQIGKIYGLPVIDGNSEDIDVQIALESNLVVATYNQAVKYAKNFDYFVIDEAHNLTAGYNYRKDVVSEVKELSDGIKTIAITATPPAELFNKLGFVYVKIDIEKTAEKVFVRRSLGRPEKTALNHILRSKRGGKIVILLKSKDRLKVVKNELIKHDLASENEILILTSDVESNSPEKEAFNKLAETQKFPDGVKFILATNVIIDGINIYDKDVTEVLFIENTFGSYPEELRQFIARFRDFSNIDFYFYHFETKQQKTLIDPNAEYFKIKPQAQNFADGLNALRSVKIEDLGEDKKKLDSFLKEQKKFVTEKNGVFVVNELAVIAEAYKRVVNSMDLSDYLAYIQNNFNVTFDLSTYNYLYEAEAVEIDKTEAEKLKGEKDKAFFEAFVKYFRDFLIFIINHSIKRDLKEKIGALEPISALRLENYTSEFESKILPVLKQNISYAEKLLYRYFEVSKYYGNINEIKDETAHLTLISFIFTADKEGNVKVRGNAQFGKLIAEFDTHFLLAFKDYFKQYTPETSFVIEKLERLINLLSGYKGQKLTSNEFAELIKTELPEALNYSFYKQKHYIKTIKTLFEVEEKRTARKRFYILTKEKDHTQALNDLLNSLLQKIADNIRAVKSS